MAECVLTVEVHGMDCEGCVKNVTNALKSVKGVSRTEISLERKRATIWLDDDRVDEEKVRSVIRKAGYVVGDSSIPRPDERFGKR